MRLFLFLQSLIWTLHANPVLSASSLKPDIRADTNRDGVVDIDGESDIESKATWSATRGAIFLPNVGDKHSRCPNSDLNNIPLSNDELAFCSDSSGHLLLAPEYIAPLRTVPLEDVSDGTTAHLFATPRAAYERVQIFLLVDPTRPNSTDSWHLVDKQYNFNATQLSAGLTLGIDSRESVKESEIWDGHVSINFDIYETPGSQDYIRDTVALKVAPVLTRHHLQKVETLVSTWANDTNPVQQYFVEQLDAGRELAGIENPLWLFNQSGDIWAQDIVEPAYASMPGPDGPIAIRIMLRSAQSTRTGGRKIFEQMRGPGFGAFQPRSGFGYHTMNSYGNLETIPPHRSKRDVLYKAGRITQGKHYDSLPAQSVRDLIFSNGVQSTLFLETGWLRVGHVDEFIQFLPYNNDLGFTIAIADTDVSIELLQDAQAAGHGSARAISFDATPQMERFQLDNLPPNLDLTIDDVLSNATFMEKWINHNLEILLSEIPLDRKDVIHVPGLYRDRSRGDVYVNPDGLDYYWPPVLKGEYQLGDFLPAPINGIVIGNLYPARTQGHPRLRSRTSPAAGYPSSSPSSPIRPWRLRTIPPTL
ncbi:hypothetical protein BDP81DRAFT_465504 [Colletotrichum phormii]|uniref:Protein-arginine deiminase C-terminal domain-containing protein n=1 Tax=Colletotrichum phormii TaxID=359342 RepID=A0AAI9ZH23_9PEZI|nr:uncharacterized protein BDP81DRAFT_465504 [Colletotrichum phormii]KAK1623301.1 hypothetical protein BDP81DRAFT_465504 [Colletotrichum phormii]